MTKDTKEFKRYIGEILTIALDVESYLEYFISNYFMILTLIFYRIKSKTKMNW